MTQGVVPKQKQVIIPTHLPKIGDIICFYPPERTCDNMDASEWLTGQILNYRATQSHPKTYLANINCMNQKHVTGVDLNFYPKSVPYMILGK